MSTPTIIRKCPRDGCDRQVEMTAEEIRSGKWTRMRCELCAPSKEETSEVPR